MPSGFDLIDSTMKAPASQPSKQPFASTAAKRDVKPTSKSFRTKKNGKVKTLRKKPSIELWNITTYLKEMTKTLFVDSTDNNKRGDFSLGTQAALMLNGIAKTTVEKLCNLATEHISVKSISAAQVETALKLFVSPSAYDNNYSPGVGKGDARKEILDWAIKNARACVIAYQKKYKPKGEPLFRAMNGEMVASTTTKGPTGAAGLQISVAKIRNLVKMLMPKIRIGMPALVYMTAVVQYLLTEVLQLSVVRTKDAKEKRVKYPTIRDALALEPVLDDILGDSGMTASQAMGGTIPQEYKSGTAAAIMDNNPKSRQMSVKAAQAQESQLLLMNRNRM